MCWALKAGFLAPVWAFPHMAWMSQAKSIHFKFLVLMFSN